MNINFLFEYSKLKSANALYNIAHRILSHFPIRLNNWLVPKQELNFYIAHRILSLTLIKF